MDIEKLGRLITSQEIIDRNNASIDRAVARLRAKGIQPAGRRSRIADRTEDECLKVRDEQADGPSAFKAA